jgi:hypothetical protein
LDFDPPKKKLKGFDLRNPNSPTQHTKPKKIEMSQPAISALVDASAHIEGAVLLLEFGNQEMSAESVSHDELLGAFMLLELSVPKSPTTVVTRDFR